MEADAPFVDEFCARAAPWLRRLLWLLAGCVLAAVVIGALLFLALGVYALAYHWLVPPPLHVFPAHLDFEQPQPATSVALPAGLLRAGQPYHVDVCFKAPATPRNRDRSNFMVKVSLQHHQGSLREGARPAHFTYTPAPARWLRNALLLPLLAAGAVSDTLDLCVRVVEDFVDEIGSLPPAAAVRVAVSDPALEVYAVELRLIAHMGGLAHAMHHWFLTSSVVGITATFALLAVGLLSCLGAVAAFYYYFGAPAVLSWLWSWWTLEPPTAPAEPSPAQVLADTLTHDATLRYDAQLKLYHFPPPTEPQPPQEHSFDGLRQRFAPAVAAADPAAS